MSGDVAKLPRWAQQRIEQLEANVAHYREKARQITDGDTDTRIISYSDGDQPLPRGSTVAFDLPYAAHGAPGRPASIEVHTEPDRGLVQIRVRGGQPLLVYPSSSNQIDLAVEASEVPL